MESVTGGHSSSWPATAIAAAWALLVTAIGGGVPQEDVVFVDVARSVGIEFTHFNGMTGHFTIAEITGQGAGLVDFDSDGDLDVYLIQGQLLGASMSEAVFPWRGSEPPKDRLYRNDLVVAKDGSRRLRFTDVTRASGIVGDGYGMGIATGDYDNDGDVDLYITNLGSNQLYRNRGDGTFEDVTAKAGVDDPRWSTCAAFFDYDRDGDLDLFVSAPTPTTRSPTGCFATAATAPSKTSLSPRGSTRSSAPASAWSRPITTSTPTSSGSTTAMARFATKRCGRGPPSTRRARPKPAWASMPMISTRTATTTSS
jgi:hypothetical protein